MTFKIPKEYQAPDGVKEGENFQEIATFKFDGDNMTLISIGQDEIPLTDSKKKEKPKGAIQSIKEKLKEGDTEGEM